MGWSRGTDVAEVFEDIIKKYVSKKDQMKVAQKAVDILDDLDWDNHCECKELCLMAGETFEEDAWEDNDNED